MSVGLMRLDDIERTIEQAGVPFKRDFDWTAGWTFEVGGEVVAQGAAIGELEIGLRVWWRTYSQRLEEPGEGPAGCT